MFVPPASADTESELRAKKAELARVEDRLDQAVAVWQAAETRLENTRYEIAKTRAEIAQTETRIERLEKRLQKRAVVAFQAGPGSTIDLLLSSGSLSEFSDRLEFLGSLAQSDSDLIVETEVAREDLSRQRERLSELEDEQARDAAIFEEAKEDLAADVARIEELVADLTAELKAEQAAQQELVLLGQTPNPDGVIQRCPVAGPNSFVDSFGWPRVGHTHQGIDLIAPYGVPIVAAHAGLVSYSSSSSGGLQAYVRTSGGTYTFYAHLSSYSGVSGQNVGAGTVIGYNGSTGNAGSVNHLHFEYHPGGGAAVNPYQMLLAVC